MWPIMVLTMVILIAACQRSRPPSFMGRVQEDCTNGDQWACDPADIVFEGCSGKTMSQQVVVLMDGPIGCKESFFPTLVGFLIRL